MISPGLISPCDKGGLFGNLAYALNRRRLVAVQWSGTGPKFVGGNPKPGHRLKPGYGTVGTSFLPCPVSDTAILYLYDQIRLCILFNLDRVAITFCGVLVEYALKYATYRKENPGADSFDSSAWNQFENLTLGPAITRARKAGLIDETREKVLHSFREDLRNKYSHFNIQKITKGFSFSATEKNVETGEEKIVELTASAPTLQILVKHRLDEENVMKVFKLADGVVRSPFWNMVLALNCWWSEHVRQMNFKPLDDENWGFWLSGLTSINHK
jgi:hypothetical protein